MSVESPLQNASYLLQIDQVGSFRLILSDRIVFSGPNSTNSHETIQILAPLSKEHASIQRVSQGYTLKPIHGLVLKTVRQAVEAGQAEQLGQQQTKPGEMSSQCPISESLLIQGEELTFPGGVSFRLWEKSPLCRTAVLEVSETDRLKDEVDGVILMDQLLILGPGRQTNICCSHWSFTGALVFRSGEFSFHLLGGQSATENQAAEGLNLSIPLQQHVDYEEAGFYLEPYL